jgi:hypothetical protein
MSPLVFVFVFVLELELELGFGSCEMKDWGLCACEIVCSGFGISSSWAWGCWLDDGPGELEDDGLGETVA